MEDVYNISSVEAYQRLKDQADSALIDVRTVEEFSSVGVPDLSDASAELLLIPIYEAPHMELNPHFENKVDEFIKNYEVNNLYFICRSGARSQTAAELFKAKGYITFNVIDGFEGKMNDDGQRGLIDGWKAAELPWRYSNVFKVI